MKIIVPMAGRGSRFSAESTRNPDYQNPKPLIPVKGKPMIRWAMESLSPMHVSYSNFIFIALDQHQKEYGVVDRLKELFSPDVNVILIPEVTRGATETAMKAQQFMDHEEIIISDSDHFFDGAALKRAIDQKDDDTKGIIPVFEPPDDEVKWSYTLFDKTTRIAEAVGEKDPQLAALGAYANIGAYYFSSGNEFAEAANSMISSGDMHGAADKQEFYIAPLYHRMIASGKKIQAAVVDYMWGLGTPKDVEYFEKNYHSSS